MYTSFALLSINIALWLEHYKKYKKPSFEKTWKIKHEILCNFFEEGGLKNVDINSQNASLQCSWVKRLYDDKFHEWKLIPLHLIKSTLGIKLHSNLDFEDSKIPTFPTFYKQLFCNWQKYPFSSSVMIPSFILSQPIWYNKNIKRDSKPFALKNLQNKIFSYMIFLIKKMSLKPEMKGRLVLALMFNLISNRHRLSIQFPKLGKKYSKKVKVIAQI